MGKSILKRRSACLFQYGPLKGGARSNKDFEAFPVKQPEEKTKHFLGPCLRLPPAAQTGEFARAARRFLRGCPRPKHKTGLRGPGARSLFFFQKRPKRPESLLFLKNRKMDFRESTARPAHECDLHTKHGTGRRQSSPMPDFFTHKFFCTGPFSSMQADSLFVPVVRSCVSREIAGRNS